MKPVLFEIPVPSVALPLGPTLALISILAALMAAYALPRRRALRDLFFVSLAACVAAAVGAVIFRGRHFVPAPIPIMSYGALLSLSLAAGWVLCLRLSGQAGLARAVSAHVYVLTAIGGLLGARVLHALTHLHDLRGLGALSFGEGGLVAYGGFLGGFAAAYWATHRQGISFFAWADVAAPSVSLGLSITRLGCYLHGCDFGRPLSASAPGWLKALGTFPRWSDQRVGTGSPAWLEHVTTLGLSPSANSSLPVHPTELYEALLGMSLLVLVWKLSSRRRFAGELFLLLVMGYGAGRFVIETFRGDLDRGLFGPNFPVLGPLSTSQWIGLATSLAALLMHRKLSKARAQAPAALSSN